VGRLLVRLPWVPIRIHSIGISSNSPYYYYYYLLYKPPPRLYRKEARRIKLNVVDAEEFPEWSAIWTLFKKEWKEEAPRINLLNMENLIDNGNGGEGLND